jgi:hypothetical protein
MSTVPSDASCAKVLFARAGAELLRTGARRTPGLMRSALRTGVRGVSAVILRRRQ